MGGLWVPSRVWFKTGFMVEKIQSSLSLDESSKPLGDCPRYGTRTWGAEGCWMLRGGSDAPRVTRRGVRGQLWAD